MKFSASTCKTFLLASDINSKVIYWKWLLYFSYYLATISGRLRKLVHVLTRIKSFDKIFSEHNFSRSTTCVMCFEKHWMLNLFWQPLGQLLGLLGYTRGHSGQFPWLAIFCCILHCVLFSAKLTWSIFLKQFSKSKAQC